MVVDIPQRITRLTPLADAFARIDMQVGLVAPGEIDLPHAIARVLAEDVAVRSAMPPKPVAVRDGWAVRSELTADASSYTPISLTQIPSRLDAGDELPAATDAIAPLDAVMSHQGRAEIVMPVAPGEGVLPAAANAVAGVPLRHAGDRLRATDLAVLAALGMTRMRVREPRIRVVHAGAPGETVAAAVAFVARAARADGAAVVADETEAGRHYLEAALRSSDADATIAIGGTGTGRNDVSVEILARAGRIEFHGVGLMPGETTAFGFAGKQPVLLLPGRLDAALASWLVLGRRLLARLSGAADDDPPPAATLSRKIASSVGIAEVVALRLAGDRAEPLAASILPLQALAGADGWILVAAESEGHPEGARVAVRLLP